MLYVANVITPGRTEISVLIRSRGTWYLGGKAEVRLRQTIQALHPAPGITWLKRGAGSPRTNVQKEEVPPLLDKSLGHGGYAQIASQLELSCDKPYASWPASRLLLRVSKLELLFNDAFVLCESC